MSDASVLVLEALAELYAYMLILIDLVFDRDGMLFISKKSVHYIGALFWPCGFNENTSFDNHLHPFLNYLSSLFSLIQLCIYNGFIYSFGLNPRTEIFLRKITYFN